MSTLFCTSSRFKQALRAGGVDGQQNAIDAFMLELQEFFPTMSPVPIGIPNSDAFLQVKGDMIEHIYALRRVPGQVKPPGFFCHRPADEMPPFVYWVDIHKPKDDQQFHQAIYDMMTWNTDFRKDLQLLAIHPSRDPRLIGAEIVPLEPTIQPTAVQKAIEALGYRLNQLPKVNFRNDQHALTTPAPESTITGIILQSNPQITPQTQAPMQWSQRKRDHSVESTFGAFKGWLSKRVRTQSGSRPQPDSVAHYLEAMRLQLDSHNQAMQTYMDAIEQRM